MNKEFLTYIRSCTVVNLRRQLKEYEDLIESADYKYGLENVPPHLSDLVNGWIWKANAIKERLQELGTFN